MTDYFQTDLSFLNIPAEVAPVRKVSIANAKGAYTYRSGVMGCWAQTPEGRKRISEINKGRTSHNKGKPLSQEQKDKMKAYFASPEYRKKLPEIMQKAWKTRRLNDLKLKRGPRKHTQATRLKLSEAQKAKWATMSKAKRKEFLAACRKGGLKRRGHKHSKQTKLLMSSKAKARWANGFYKSRKYRPFSAKHLANLRKHLAGLKKAHCKSVQTPKGKFASIKDAAKAYNVSAPNMSYWIKISKSKQFYFIKQGKR